MRDGAGGVLDLPSPLARLYGMAMEGGIDVSDYKDVDPPWPDAEVVAMVMPGQIVFSPELGDDDLRADVMAFAVALCCSMVVADTAAEGYVAAPDGLVLVCNKRLPEPAKGPGRLAGMFARRCGRDVDSATFDIQLPGSG